jgi:hypothetical protein
MAILSDGSYPTPLAGASDLLHLYDYFWSLAFAGTINDRLTGRCASGAAAVGVAGQAGASFPAQPVPEEQSRRHGDYAQGHDLLPIHAENIASFRSHAKQE